MSAEATVLFVLLYLTAMYNSFPVWFSCFSDLEIASFCSVEPTSGEDSCRQEKKFFVPFKFLKSFHWCIDEISVEEVHSSHRHNLNTKSGE